MARKTRTRGTHVSDKSTFWDLLASPNSRFAVFCVFAAVVFLTGGGSRADIASLVLLRPFAVFVVAYALFVAEPGQMRLIRTPLALLFLLAALMAIQLIPLPQAWWSSLPGRDLYVRIQADAGLGDMARPLTLSPSRTLNALFSLVVPLATMSIVAVQPVRHHRKLLYVIAVAGIVAVVWAAAQIAGPPRGPLYTYAQTNNGFPVGPFANRNHLALFLAMILVLIGYVSRRLILEGALKGVSAAALGGGALVVLALVLVAGSRAGLVLALVAAPLAIWLTWSAFVQSSGPPSRKVKIALALVVVAGIAATAAMGVYNSQAESIERLSGNNAFLDVRTARWPIVLEMLRQHWMAGIGFGAFQGVFQSYETSAILTPFIFNQAHNDWMQFPLEGGLAATILLVLALAWTTAKAVPIVAASRRRVDGVGLVAIATPVLTALASVVDYPLRTPIVAFICATCLVLLAARSETENK